MRVAIVDGVVKKNCSLVLLKPHACTGQALSFLREYLMERGLKITVEGIFSGKDLHGAGIVDKQYGDIARRAMLLKPQELTLSSSSFIRFQKKFGMSWSDAVEDNVIFNAVDLCDLLQIDAATLGEAWMQCVSDGKVVKLGRGFYCGLIDTIPNQPAIFCVNGFFLAMRAEYLAVHASVHYFLVEWDDVTVSWSDFRKKVIGATSRCASSRKATCSTKWVWSSTT